MRVMPYGRDSLLLEFDSLEAVRGAEAAIRRHGFEQITEVVPALRTILVTFTPGADRTSVLRVAESAPAVAAPDGPLVTIATTYDGVDLAAVADEVGYTVAEVIDAHASVEFVGACAGFAPGWCYLVGLPAELQVARLASPRPRVEAGSVGIARDMCGIYPTASPGGWQLLGHTDAPLWDPRRNPPALIGPGTRVRFVPQ